MNPSRPTVRLMTWNIHRGFGPDRKCDLARIVATVRRHRPDIVALQEVDSRPGWGSKAADDVLREALGPHAAQAKAISAADGDYGHMVLSRWPLDAVRVHDLSVGRREKRLAIETRVATAHGALHLVTAHLGLFPRERRSQAAMLAALARATPGAVVMAGDFNEWSRRGSVAAALLREMPARTEQRTFPARLPLGALDRIYCRPAEALIGSWSDPAARIASDHLPLIAEIAMPSLAST